VRKFVVGYKSLKHKNRQETNAKHFCLVHNFFPGRAKAILIANSGSPLKYFMLGQVLEEFVKVAEGMPWHLVY
jgi:hypothetical protein